MSGPLPLSPAHGFRAVYLTEASKSPDMLNATALGALGFIPDLARRLSVELDHVEMTIKTKNGDVVTVRLERSEEPR